MEKKVKYIVRQVEPEAAELSFYFDDDGFTEAAGNFCYTLFLLESDYGRVYGYNVETWKEYVERADFILSDMEWRGTLDYDGRKITAKSIMEEYGIPYNSVKAHKLIEWAKNADTRNFDDMAVFLSIVTGREWKTMGIHGYCQGDYVTAIFCPDFNSSETAEICGEVYLGCANEYGVIELDENGEEADSCYGYIVADCQAWRDEDIKSLVCEWADIPVEETQLEMIDGQHTYTTYSYRTA